MTPESGAALEEQGKALHLNGEYASATEVYEQAYAAYRQEGDRLAAARAARTVAWFRGWLFGDWAVYAGWMGRASALLEQSGGDGNEHGWVLFAEARAGNDLEQQRALYLAAVDVARRFGDNDLECEAMASLGMMLVFSGFVDEGMTHLDNALAAVCAGDVEELPIVEGCLCGLFNACERTHDVGRAQEWLRAADDLIQRRKLVAVAGYCRAHYGGILTAAGRWAEAETELTAATRILPVGLAIRANALCRLADLRIRQGRLEEAAELLAGVEQHEDAVVPLAALHLARDEPELALELLERVLGPGGLEDHVEVPLLALVADAHLALGSTDEALNVSARLTELARNQSSHYLKAVAALIRGRLCIATGDGDARACLHQAMSMFASAHMPVELASARLELAHALASDRPVVAIAEATAALESFQELDAARQADAAAALLRTLGAPARTGPKGRAGLTKREDEVLDLLGHGLTNAEIGERLYISPKTVEHHVGRILAKLGVRSRAQATAQAVRTSAKPTRP